ncbi:hypothetical protein [Paraburkholderia acidisoli]|uniref:hypothetical protein n=1 Tax=Paraburkholderia acidisoli TaxID=2571748 RepID=UPI002D7F5029|nr:hypothetical protein [Paraburkholderia acidisoli]
MAPVAGWEAGCAAPLLAGTEFSSESGESESGVPVVSGTEPTGSEAASAPDAGCGAVS